MAKLSKIGITGDLLRWFQNYLTDREQRVVINGQSSDWRTIMAGVPQGSVLGPLLFLIYINDLTSVIQSSEVRLFADDTILYVIVDNPADSAEALNMDLGRLTEWAEEWIVKFSSPKTKTMYISRRNVNDQKPQLKMDGVAIDETTTHKHLGVILSEDLSWKDHIEYVATSAGKCLDVLNALKYKLDRQTLENLYVAFIRSKLEYASIVWDNCTEDLSDLVESVQYRAGKIISGAIARTSHNLLYAELGWESLKARRQKQRLKLMYKIVHKDAPLYWQDTLPEANQAPRYNLRTIYAGDIPNIHGRTVFYDNTFFPKSIREWNNTSIEIKQAPSTESFAARLNANIEPVPKWFLSGDRKASIIHARLCMLCSPLNDHLYSNIHVVDSPSCACGHPRESNKHFLLECPLFNNERVEMTDSLEAIDFDYTVMNLLYGNSKYSTEKNIEACGIIQKFIIDSGRSSPPVFVLVNNVWALVISRGEMMLGGHGDGWCGGALFLFPSPERCPLYTLCVMYPLFLLSFYFFARGL